MATLRLTTIMLIVINSHLALSCKNGIFKKDGTSKGDDKLQPASGGPEGETASRGAAQGQKVEKVSVPPASTPSNNSGVNGQKNIIVDHNSLEIEKIPDELIVKAKREIVIYTAHQSHGQQIVPKGLELLANSNSIFGFKTNWINPPPKDPENAFLRIMDRGGDYKEFWQSDGGKSTIDALEDENNREINLVMFIWCWDLDKLTDDDVHSYLVAMEQFEKRYQGQREVKFVYTTGNADHAGAEGYNRYMNNEMIRNWVKSSQNVARILYDFADIESYLYDQNHAPLGKRQVYRYIHKGKAVDVPIRPDQYRSEECGHTTNEACLYKARAFWWMLARVAGWQGM